MKIYGFVYTDETGLHCFYIGRTGNMRQREQAHRRFVKNPNAQDAHLLKYEECRDLEARGITWSMVELAEVGIGEYEVDSERAMVIEMVLSGHKLANLKHGDITKPDAAVTELEDMISKGVRTTADVKKYREDKEKASKERQVEKAEKLAQAIEQMDEIRRVEQELREAQTEKERLRHLARIKFSEEVEARGLESKRQREAEIARKKIRDDQVAIQLAEVRKQQDAEWQSQKQFETWKRNLHGYK